MANQRWKTFPKKKGSSAGNKGKGADTFSPVKTKNWPGLPGGTQPKRKDSNGSGRKMCQGLADKGV